MIFLGTHTAPQAHAPASTTHHSRSQRQQMLKAGFAAIALAVALGACSVKNGRFNDFDIGGGATKKDYESLLDRRMPEEKEKAADEPPIPGFQSVLAAPSAPELADIRRVSIAVTETTPVRDILIELARKAQVDLELDPRIAGGIIMTATDRPFIDVIARIADLAELRYKFERNVLRVEIDDPYLEQYRMDVLNIIRTSSSSAASSTDATSTNVGGGGGGAGNQSASSISTTTNSNFWEGLGANITSILQGIQSRRSRNDAQLRAAFIPEPAPRPAPAAAPAPTAAPKASGTTPGAGVLNQAAGLGLGGRQAELDANLEQDNPTPEPAAPAAQEAAADGAAANAPAASSQYSLNPQAGIVTLFATQRQHKAVERYLRDVREAVNQQVLIEAKVLEVTLSDQYRAGVDWTAIFGPNNAAKQLNVGTNFTRNVVPPEFSNPTITADWSNGGDLSIAAQLVNEFGTVRTLSSPRLTVLNNQMAQLRVAENQVFFQLTLNVTDQTPTTAAKTTVTSQIKTVPVGLIMNVQPAVDPISKRISLSLRPSITRVTSYVNDPGVAVTIAVAQNNNPDGGIPTVSSPIPVVEVREMDSIVTMDSGQTVVMGGLMQDTGQTLREGLPGVMDIPLVGQAVSENIKVNKVTELVIFIRATLANAPKTVADEDIRLYKTFTPDPRPIAF